VPGAQRPEQQAERAPGADEEERLEEELAQDVRHVGDGDELDEQLCRQHEVHAEDHAPRREPFEIGAHESLLHRGVRREAGHRIEPVVTTVVAGRLEAQRRPYLGVLREGEVLRHHPHDRAKGPPAGGYPEHPRVPTETPLPEGVAGCGGAPGGS
jgi:hypothetical protein